MPGDVSRHELNAEPGALTITGTDLAMVVSKHMRVTTEGYRRAVERLREAIAADDGDGVYISVTEAATWATSLADRAELKSNPDISGLIYARDRSYHQWASIVEKPEGEGWKWRAADLLPTSENEQHQGLTEKLPNYKAQLEGKPVIEVFERLKPLIEGLDAQEPDSA